MVGDRSGSISPEELVSFLKKNLQYQEVRLGVLQQAIVNRAAAARGIEVDQPEIQAEADRQRRERHLERAADTLAWLSNQQITAEEWEAGIRDRLLTQKLIENLFGNEVESYFVQNRLDFDQVVLYQIIVPYEQLATELFYQIEESEISFFEAAHLYDIDPNRRQYCGYEGKLYRWSLKPEIAAVVFAADPRQIIPPVQTEQGFHLLRVEEFITAQLTPETRQEILQRLFREWLNGELNYWLNPYNLGEQKNE
ncbi:peptidylprolyl isomerase [Leptodesmis sichuanensis A121]|nr:peptidylprolyl isomerase [Leptodesmis sichuanensis A121]